MLLITVVLFFSSCEKRSEEDTNNPKVIFPNGGEIILKGISYDISWSNAKGNPVLIELFKDGISMLQINAEPIHGNKYHWEVPSNIEDSRNYAVRITDINTGITDVSDHSFSIQVQNPTSSFIDERDGQEYKTVKIGSQWWMAQNFNYRTDSGSVCYEYRESNCEEKGKLYTWFAAYNNAPAGWRLPSDEDWKILETTLGIPSNTIDLEGSRGIYEGHHLKIGGGTGFDAVYAGYCNARVGKFGHIDYEARFWTSSNSSEPGNAWSRNLKHMQGSIHRHQLSKVHGLSARYVKDD